MNKLEAAAAKVLSEYQEKGFPKHMSAVARSYLKKWFKLNPKKERTSRA